MFASKPSARSSSHIRAVPAGNASPAIARQGIPWTAASATSTSSMPKTCCPSTTALSRNFKLSDVDGVSHSYLSDLSAAHAAANAAAAAAAASCTDAVSARIAGKAATSLVWSARSLLPAPVEPYMATDIYSPPEFWVGWAREALVSGEAAGRAYEWDMMQLREEAVEQPCWPGAVMLLDSLKSECATRDAARAGVAAAAGHERRPQLHVRRLAHLPPGCDHQPPAAGGGDRAERAAWRGVCAAAGVCERAGGRDGGADDGGARQPAHLLQRLRRRLAEMRGGWCYWG
ncbi:hypothetical protein CHLRE_03g194567v5 [Chlamydomonas reinhardtii]|uniref:Uncharacterized protein n=1 Tax=Chlamydomonas reinhardtii TaxID=3055 RepID=A0A2K3DYI6_CHLRE|nr:uncharacterized protein CHLRE_03g194567v5 [Chlamydomonas reinhardtii]PNW85606.1 hypothetical protein CHLRE_03g194567v5 [Chlamydomonas reinhardtii]